MDGSEIKTLALPKGCLVITVKQNGKDLVPSGDTILQYGDQISILIRGEPALEAIQSKASGKR